MSDAVKVFAVQQKVYRYQFFLENEGVPLLCEAILQPLCLLLIASTQPTCAVSVATSTNILREYTFLKVQIISVTQQNRA